MALNNSTFNTTALDEHLTDIMAPWPCFHSQELQSPLEFWIQQKTGHRDT